MKDQNLIPVCTFQLINFFVVAGLLFTCSLYYVSMLEEFGESRSYTAWVGSLVNAFVMLGSELLICEGKQQFPSLFQRFLNLVFNKF